jgi:pimeloyl-ACP methyl ester carboxylesterase
LPLAILVDFGLLFPTNLMLSTAVVAAAQQLTELTSIDLFQKIQFQSIPVLGSERPVSTSYIQQGASATPLLLLHGFDSSVLEFRRLFPLLPLEVWAIDLLGFGFTERLPGLAYSSQLIQQHLYQFWRTTINRPMVIVGASMGGATAIDFALAHPEAVAKLILIDSAGFTKPPATGKLMFSPLDRLAAAFLSNPRVRQRISQAAYYDTQWASPDAQLCAALHLPCENWTTAIISFTKSGGYGYYGDRLMEISQPTLILWGENDKILGIKDAQRFREQLPHSQLIWLAKCGHVPHLEQPQATATAILGWV